MYVYNVAQFVPPVVVLSTIYQVTNHQPPVLSGHYKGATKEEVALKERKKVPKEGEKTEHPCYEPFNTQFTKDQKTGASLFLANSNFIQARRRRTIKL